METWGGCTVSHNPDYQWSRWTVLDPVLAPIYPYKLTSTQTVPVMKTPWAWQFKEPQNDWQGKATLQVVCSSSLQGDSGRATKSRLPVTMFSWLLNISKDEYLSGQGVVGQAQSEKVFPDIQKECPVFKFMPIASGPGTGYHWKEPVLSSLE